MKKINPKIALEFIILLGLISLFADISSDGARSIVGPYLAILGASATVVGFVAGLGELVSYGLRIVSGYIVEFTGNYWIIALVGYLATLLAVPMLALAGHWEFAALLIVIERFGKAMRTPARDAMLAHASQRLGRGWGFGLHKMLDQIGAMTGPIIVTVVLFLNGTYQQSFLILIIPALIALAILTLARKLYPHPKDLETEFAPAKETNQPISTFWIYLGGAALVAAGYADFPLIAFHFQKTAIVPIIWIPILYSIALGASGITALLFGSLFDHNGYIVLILIIVMSSLFAPLVFLGGFYLACIGMILWGIGMGSQISIMRAIIANMIPMNKRGSAYGIFNAGYGIFWFLGSSLMGMLYGISITYLVIFSLVAQLSAIPLFLAVKQRVS
ncbi:MAG: MFS transporter [Coxiella sp. DG_40]|nr:MAG: MFS transporter [Coxiella sp. DG_40]